MSRDHASFWYALPNVAVTLDNATDDPPPSAGNSLQRATFNRWRAAISAVSEKDPTSLFSSKIFESGAFHDILLMKNNCFDVILGKKLCKLIKRHFIKLNSI